MVIESSSNRFFDGLSYAENQNPRQVLDLYLPEGEGPFPLIVWIHGGGWAMGDRKLDFSGAFLKKGFALASLEYRLTREGHPFPAQIEDCVTALHWLKKNAGRYHLNVEKIGVTGHSAGAHLSALIASSGGANPFADAGAVVQAAVLLSGPFDLDRERGKWSRDYFPWRPDDQFSLFFFPGGAYDATFAGRASASPYLRKNLPPLLVIHGEKDTIVPIGQARLFAESAGALGALVEFRSQPEGTHDILDPETISQTVDFFVKVLIGHET